MKEGGGDQPAQESPLAELGTRQRSMSKTPLFTATNSARYSRQNAIREIDQSEGTSLICYVCGDRAQIERNDTLGFVELLHNVGPEEPVDLMLHTCGGDVDASEKIISLIKANVGNARLRVIIPDMAKSAGTLIALAAQDIHMSASSELGMIDPQYAMKDSQGNWFHHSATAYLRAFEKYTGMLSGGARDALAERMLLDFDAKVVAKFAGIEARVRTLAERLLRMNNGLNYTTIAGELLNPERWQTHGQPISAEDAKDIGLPVSIIEMNDPRWQRYWALYCLQRTEVGKDHKIFESSYVCQVVERTKDDDE